MILRLLNWQGMAGIAASLTLLVMLTVQKLDAVHWKKLSESFEQLYQKEQAAFATTVASARSAADAARAADQANIDRVAAQQLLINERTASDFEARLAAARDDAERLRIGTHTAADSGARRSTSVSRLPVAAVGSVEGAGQDRLPQDDRLTATEQAIQLDELIKWVRAQAKVDNNSTSIPTQGD